MSKFGGGKSDNGKIVEEQRRQAEEAERKEQLRQARLEEGRAIIDALYGTIGDDFYDQYRTSILDYYQPQLAQQYQDLQSQTLFDLGRRGVLASSDAADKQARNLQRNLDQEAVLYNNADQAAGQLRSDVSRSKASAINLLQSTEDPTVGADTALTEVNAVQTNRPQLSPLGDVFNVAAQAYQTYRNARDNQRFYNSLPRSNPYTSTGRVVS